MRIATVCFSRSLGGLELATLRRGADLLAHGHHVVAVVPEAPAVIEHARSLGLATDVITPTLPYMDLPAARMLSMVFEREAIDAALVGRTRDLSTVMIAAGRPRAVVLYQQMQSGLDKHDWFHNRVYRRLDACITITERGRQEMVKHTALPAERIAVIPYGVDAASFSAEAVDRDAARAEYGVPQDALAVGIVGRLDPGKGQGEFLQALGLVAERAPDLAGCLYGLVIGRRQNDPPEYTAELERMHAALPNREHVAFHPFAADPRTAFRALDVFVLASHAETFGMVVQEAMAMGPAVIGTDAGGVPEIITHDRNGLLVPPKNASAIADAIIRLARDPALRERLAAEARAFVTAAYDMERQYRAMETVLQEAVQKR